MRPATHRFVIPLSAVIVALGFASGVPAVAGHRDSARSAQVRVSDAVNLVRQMKQDPALAAALQQARGVFIIPHYGRGGFILGGQDGGGVVLVKHASGWSSPAFYNLSGGSIGAQAGGEGGAVAMILMSQKAVDRFASSSSGWSLNGNAGLTVVSWSGRAEATTSRGDAIVWSNTSGLYGGLTASLTHVSPDITMDRSYYQRPVTTREILAGNVSNPNADPLRDALAARVAQSDTAPREDVTPFQSAKLSLTQAIADSQKQMRGKTLDARFGVWQGRPAYIIRTYSANQVWQSRIDANTGQPLGQPTTVSRTELGPQVQRDITALNNAPTSLDQAVSNAEQREGGKAIMAGVKGSRSGNATYNVDLVKNGRVRTAMIDASTGQMR